MWERNTLPSMTLVVAASRLSAIVFSQRTLCLLWQQSPVYFLVRSAFNCGRGVLYVLKLETIWWLAGRSSFLAGFHRSCSSFCDTLFPRAAEFYRCLLKKLYVLASESALEKKSMMRIWEVARSNVSMKLRVLVTFSWNQEVCLFLYD